MTQPNKNSQTDHTEGLLKYFSQFITENKLSRFEEVLQERTRHITIVLEDIYQPHNASATIRSCDLFGIQDLHVIENKNRYTINPDVTLGSSKWVNLHRYNRPDENNSPRCLQDLKDKGYLLIATTPYTDKMLPDLPVDQPMALLFGTEETGLTDEALEMSDDRVRIPMYGFTESFNISVSVALSLYDTVTRLKRSGLNWALPESVKQEIRLQWMRKVIRKHAMLEAQYYKENKDF